MAIARVTDPDDLQACLDVRERVFVREQGVPLDREVDGKDDEATHFLARDADGRPVGCARLREYERGTAKVERVAVLADRRGEGWGKDVMAAVEEHARRAGYDEAVLDAQVPVVGFYDVLGYEARGEVFEDAGIPHRRMRKSL